VGQSARTAGHPARTVGQSARTVGQSARTVGQSARTVGQTDHTVGQSDHTVGEPARTVGQSAHMAGRRITQWDCLFTPQVLPRWDGNLAEMCAPPWLPAARNRLSFELDGLVRWPIETGSRRSWEPHAPGGQRV